MRFFTTASFILVIVALLSVASADVSMSSQDLEGQMIRHYLMRRAEHDHSTTTNTTAATSTGAATTTTTTTTKATKKKNTGPFASPDVLQDGTLFYIGISITVLLWTTGKIIDVKTERQERYAESLVHSI